MKTHQLQDRTWQENLHLQAGRPISLIRFKPIYFEGQDYFPNFGDRSTLLIFGRKMPKKVSFIRAYSGWRAGGAKELHELGEGRAFFRWLQRHELSIEWRRDDFLIHPLFSGENIPKHHPEDDFAKGLSFALRPVQVKKRKVKLYLQDGDVLSLLKINSGTEKDFLAIVEDYIEMRFDWDTNQQPAPGFLEWVKSRSLKPAFHQGQIGFGPLITYIR
jgi:hypothetical protein